MAYGTLKRLKKGSRSEFLWVGSPDVRIPSSCKVSARFPGDDHHYIYFHKVQPERYKMAKTEWQDGHVQISLRSWPVFDQKRDVKKRYYALDINVTVTILDEPYLLSDRFETELYKNLEAIALIASEGIPRSEVSPQVGVQTLKVEQGQSFHGSFQILYPEKSMVTEEIPQEVQDAIISRVKRLTSNPDNQQIRTDSELAGSLFDNFMKVVEAACKDLQKTYGSIVEVQFSHKPNHFPIMVAFENDKLLRLGVNKEGVWHYPYISWSHMELDSKWINILNRMKPPGLDGKEHEFMIKQKIAEKGLTTQRSLRASVVNPELREAVIRVAHEKPELRKAALKFLKNQG